VAAHHALLDADGLSSAAAADLRAGRAVSDERLGLAMATRTRWQAQVATALADVDVLALPTMVSSPPLLSDVAGYPFTRLTKPLNLADVPALAMPVPSPGRPVAASLQLVGPMYRQWFAHPVSVPRLPADPQARASAEPAISTCHTACN
jgi:amidase